MRRACDADDERACSASGASTCSRSLRTIPSLVHVADDAAPADGDARPHLGEEPRDLGRILVAGDAVDLG